MPDGNLNPQRGTETISNGKYGVNIKVYVSLFISLQYAWLFKVKMTTLSCGVNKIYVDIIHITLWYIGEGINGPYEDFYTEHEAVHQVKT